MNFRPTTDPRNWRTRSREARTQAGHVLSVAQDVTDARIYLGFGIGSGALLITEAQLTPAEAFALGTELLNAAMQATKEPTCTQG